MPSTSNDSLILTNEETVFSCLLPSSYLALSPADFNLIINHTQETEIRTIFLKMDSTNRILISLKISAGIGEKGTTWLRFYVYTPIQSSNVVQFLNTKFLNYSIAEGFAVLLKDWNISLEPIREEAFDEIIETIKEAGEFFVNKVKAVKALQKSLYNAYLLSEEKSLN